MRAVWKCAIGVLTGLACVSCGGEEAQREDPPEIHATDDAASPPERASATAPPAAETGFLEVPPFSYTLEDGVTRTTATHRIFHVFRPVQHGGPAPLLVVYNGGPGVSSATLLTSGSLAQQIDFTRLDALTLVESPRSWTDFASVLVLDGPDSGFSYRIVDDPGTTPFDFDPDADASILLRAILTFLARHPDYVPRRLGFVGESYGGVRTTLMLDRIFTRHEPLQVDGGVAYEDTELAAAVDVYLRRIWPTLEPTEITDAELGTHLAQVHIQGLVLGAIQADCNGVVLDPSCPPVPRPAGCLAVLEDEYHCDLNYYEALALTTLPDLAVTLPHYFEELLGTSMLQIPELSPAARHGALRRDEMESYTEPLEMIALLGALPPTDAYYRAMIHVPAGVGVRTSWGDVGHFRDVERPLSDTFLKHVWHVPAFFTNAGLDVMVRTDVLPLLIDALDGVRASLETSPRPGVARPGWLEICSEEAPERCQVARYAPYPEAGHMVTLRAGEAFAEDLAQWLEELDSHGEDDLRR